MSGAAPSWTFQWLPREHAAVTRVLVREQFASGVGGALKWTVIAILVCSTLVAAYAAAVGDWGSVARLGPLVVVVWLAVLHFPRVTGWMRVWVVRRRDPNVAHPFTWTFDDDAVRIAMRTAGTELKWDGLHHVRETPDLFLFYYHHRAAYFFPKRAVEPPAEVNRLRALIRGRLPPGVPYVES